MPPPTVTAEILPDAAGVRHEVAADDARIVSAVPSITELLFDLGLGARVVGRTGFCIHPREQVRSVARVGGTKTLDPQRIRRLAPTHLIVNVDENPRALVEEVARFVPHVIVTHPCAPEDNLGLFRLLGGIFSREAAAQALCAAFEQELARTRAAAATLPPQRVLYLIWKAPWMTVSDDTYIARTLAAAGWTNAAPPARTRYPGVELEPALLAHTDLVLLSSEPYAFTERHAAALRESLPAGCRTRVALIDGTMVSWYGSRALAGMAYLRQLRAELA